MCVYVCVCMCVCARACVCARVADSAHVSAEQVDFVKDAISTAEVNFLEEPDEESQKERRARSMAEERASLPIYPYRQQLLDAIREEQVLVCVMCVCVCVCVCRYR